MPAGSEFQFAPVKQRNTRDASEGLDDPTAFVVDDARSPGLDNDVSFSILASSQWQRDVDLDDVIPRPPWSSCNFQLYFQPWQAVQELPQHDEL